VKNAFDVIRALIGFPLLLIGSLFFFVAILLGGPIIARGMAKALLKAREE